MPRAASVCSYHTLGVHTDTHLTKLRVGRQVPPEIPAPPGRLNVGAAAHAPVYGPHLGTTSLALEGAIAALYSCVGGSAQGRSRGRSDGRSAGGGRGDNGGTGSGGGGGDRPAEDEQLCQLLPAIAARFRPSLCPRPILHLNDYQHFLQMAIGLVSRALLFLLPRYPTIRGKSTAVLSPAGIRE